MECPHCGHENSDSELESVWLDLECPDYFDVECFECEGEFKIYAEPSVDLYLVDNEDPNDYSLQSPEEYYGDSSHYPM